MLDGFERHDHIKAVRCGWYIDGVSLNIAQVVAILVFGGLWGFWGIFFAIPLATVVQAVLKAWPRVINNEVAPESQSAETDTDTA